MYCQVVQWIPYIQSLPYKIKLLPKNVSWDQKITIRSYSLMMRLINKAKHKTKRVSWWFRYPQLQVILQQWLSIKTHGNGAAGYVNENLIPRSLTIEHIRVLFDTRFTSISFFRQSIFDVLNFQRKFWIHHFRVMDDCLHSHEQRDRQENRSNRQNGGRLVKSVFLFLFVHYFAFFSAAIHRSMTLNIKGDTKQSDTDERARKLYVIFDFSRSRLANKS